MAAAVAELMGAEPSAVTAVAGVDCSSSSRLSAASPLGVAGDPSAVLAPASGPMPGSSWASSTSARSEPAARSRACCRPRLGSSWPPIPAWAPGRTRRSAWPPCTWPSVQAEGSGRAPARAGWGVLAVAAAVAGATRSTQPVTCKPATRSIQAAETRSNRTMGRPGAPAATTPPSASAASSGSVSNCWMRSRRWLASRSKLVCKRISSRRATWSNPGSMASVSSSKGSAT